VRRGGWPDDVNMQTLSKEQSRLRWSELRGMLCQWDPIGVMDDPKWPRDEYDCMIGPLLRLLESGSSAKDIAAYLRAQITEHFGLSPEHYDFASIARQIRSWFGGREGRMLVDKAMTPTKRTQSGK